MSSLKRTIVRSMCKAGLRKMGPDKKYWNNQAHAYFQIWWQDDKKKLYGAAFSNISRNEKKHKIMTEGVLKKKVA